MAEQLHGKIVIEESDPRWPALFEREAIRIRQALGERALRIEHAGSTSVPGLCAKPVIDILLEVEDTGDEGAYVPALERAGYSLRIREPDWYEHRLLKATDPDVNLHVFPAHCPEISRILLFRDWLRSNGADRDLYARTKLALACRSWENVDQYASAKTAVIAEILARARRSRG